MLSMTIRVPEKLGKKLAALSKQTGRTKSFYVRQALDHDFEDMEDVYLADQSRAEIMAGGVLLSQEEVERRYAR